MIALSAAVVAARGAAGQRPTRRRRAGTETQPPPVADAPATEPATAVPAELPTAPWIASHGDRFLAAAALASLIAAVALNIVDRLDRLPPAWEGTPLGVTLLALVLWGVYLMWKVPQWQAAARAARGGLGERDLFEIENAARGTLGQILSGVAVLTGLLFAWQQLGNTNENLAVSQQGQITDRFSRAVEQLGSDDPAVRIGAIYALDRIAQDSERDFRPSMEVLAAFVRRPPAGAAGAIGTPAPARGRDAEIRSALSVLAENNPALVGTGECLNLYQAQLPGLDLSRASLQHICFLEADLRGANLSGADLSGSSLTRAAIAGASVQDAIMQGVDLSFAGFSGGNLAGADLTGADLRATDLRNASFSPATRLGGADVNGADFTNALLFGVDLTGVRSLSQAQLDAALTDTNTRVAAPLVNRPDFVPGAPGQPAATPATRG